MSDSMLAQLVFAWLLGGALGACFFGGLWWTLRQALSCGTSTRRPASWLLVSWLVRVAIVLLGFYAISNGDPAAPAMGLVGFLMARFAVLRATRPAPACPQLDRGQPPCA
jgi:F1F0 ATPase subunit 2